VKPNQDKALQLESERNAQKQYRKVLHDDASRPPVYSGPANGKWTGTGVPKPMKVGTGDLLGRVAVLRPDQDLLDGGTDFYIGERYAKINGVNVFGWANPVACTFYRNSNDHYLCDDVAAIRAFTLRSGNIADFVDETVHPEAPAEPFSKQTLVIPPPPIRQKLPIPGTVSKPSPHSRAPAQTQRQSAQQQSTTAPKKQRHQPDLPPLRAEELLREQLAAPRTKSLAPVLATLQPDQYDLVTRPAMDSMIIEGQPGTGKTIVASHRAAYLVNDETPPENTLDGTVLVVGPTAGYSRHVRDVIRRLAGPTDRIKVMSLPELVNHIIGVKQPPRSHKSFTWHDVDWHLAKFARSAIDKLKKAKGVTPQPEAIYDYLRANAGSVTHDRDWVPYLRHLPPYKTAISDGTHAPLVAFIKWEVNRPRDLAMVEHVIVDEAQDVTPLEWLLLDEINEADTWTILGDLNQRRSDHTSTSWSNVLDIIAIEEETPILRLERGYRSTRPILEYANRLLPRNQRKIVALQEIGPFPTVLKSHMKELPVQVVREVDRLIEVYPTGTVAVICCSPPAITKALRGQGWASSADQPMVWRNGSREVTVTVVDEARGLEFDAVVVVEPAAFPENIGRQGPLYTALTRANRQLSVVHSRALPDQLRTRW